VEVGKVGEGGMEKVQITKAIMTKNDKAGDMTLLDFKLYYKAREINTP
jgi:hypothetical protein